MEYKFNIPCSTHKLRDIRAFVSDVLSKYRLDEIQINTLVLAVDELCANLMIHSHQCNPAHYIELIIEVEAQKGITFKLIDHGMGFNILNYREPSVQEVVKEKRKGGIGILLVKKIMDEIEFIKEKDLNVCRLFKRIDNGFPKK
jgi:serine/threonine-protein kinase RsbW